ncbi:hypothetical protein Tco_0223997 [Tanacetum coccineum]
MVVRGCDNRGGEGFGGGDEGDDGDIVVLVGGDDEVVGVAMVVFVVGRMMYGEVVWEGRRWCVGCWPELGWPENLPEKMAAPEVVREERGSVC